MSRERCLRKTKEGTRKRLAKPPGRGLWRLPEHLENSRLCQILFLMPIFQHPASTLGDPPALPGRQ